MHVHLCLGNGISIYTTLKLQCIKLKMFLNNWFIHICQLSQGSTLTFQLISLVAGDILDVTTISACLLAKLASGS